MKLYYFNQALLQKKVFFIRCDILIKNKNGFVDIYEVKASNEVKKSKKINKEKSNHYIDLCFQKIVLEKNNYKVRHTYLIHTNSNYVYLGEIDVNQLFVKKLFDEELKEGGEIYSLVKNEMQLAYKLLNTENIDMEGCSCIESPKSLHCDAFEYFNGSIDKGSIYEFPRISSQKISLLRSSGIEKMKDIDDFFKLTKPQDNFRISAIRNEPLIDEKIIDNWIKQLRHPLYFLDFETVSTAIPRIVGTSPWKQISFQFSLHILDKDDNLTHKESLVDSFGGFEKIAEDMEKYIGEEGSIIAWHASFEAMQIKKLILRYVSHSEQLESKLNRLMDLKDPFKDGYIDANFLGSFSIKNVLPVICKDLSYKNLKVQDGTQAMQKWLEMVEEKNEIKKEKIYRALLEYCKLDTYAMVELYKFLRSIVG